MGTKIVYNHKAIEKKWREKWEETPVNPRNGKDGNKKPKYYCLDMFPYPSGNGLHVGHQRLHILSNVLHEDHFLMDMGTYPDSNIFAFYFRYHPF